MGAATQPFDPRRPYNDLRPLPPDADIDTRDILRACIEARAAVAELKQAGHLLPNQAILINILPILEARASSAVENIVTTTDRLFQYAQDETQPADAATKEALRYRTALRRGFESLAHRPLTTATAVEVCRTLRGIDTDIRSVPGTAAANAATGTMVYTPPDGQDRLRSLLANWERYLHDNTTVDAMIRMAVGHYQFEAIHPFTDGNGRTGRILNLLYLVDQKLLDQPVLHLSRAIIRNKIDYYRLLNAVTSDAAWEPWVRYMLEAVAETARWTTAKIHAIRDLLRDTTAFVQRRAPAVYTRELVELIFARPYCRIANVVEAGLAQRQTASEYLKQLRDIGVLDELKVGREKLFIHPRLMTLLKSEEHVVPQYESGARTHS
jgi:Fic family protein